MTDISISPDPVAGLPSTISVTVKNQGTCAAPGFVVQYKQSASSLTGPSKSVSPLAAGASQTVVVSSTFSYPTAGNYQSQVRVDTGNAVRETNENNNLEIKSVTVAAATKNLVIDDFVVNPQPVVQGEVATATIKVRNTGNSPSGAFRLNFTPYVGGLPLSRQLDSLGPGESIVVDRDYTYTFARAVTATATVDTTNTVKETNENDNTATLNYVVEPPKPDLQITQLVTTPNPAVAGSPTSTTITVKNTGNGNAGAFQVQWRPFALAQPLVWQVNSLARGASTDVTFTYTFASAGVFNGTATADATKVISEVNENNNTRDQQVTVNGGAVDLEVTDLCVGPKGQGCTAANPVQGAEQTAYITIRNNGNFPSGTFVTSWNPDTAGLIPGGPQTVTQQVDSIGAGDSVTIELDFTYPRTGNFRTLATVDAFGAVTETNETNNQKIYNLSVDPAPNNLVIDDFHIDPGSPVRGVPATATVTVRNDGPLATGRFSVQFKPKANGIASTQSVNGLNPQESRTLTFNTTYGIKGNYTMSTVIDSGNTVPEPNGGENDNTQSVDITVVPQQTTLEVTLKSLSVIHDGDNVGSGEWEPIAFAIFDQAASCSGQIASEVDFTVPKVQCFLDNRDTDDGDVINYNKTLTVTLTEQTPLLFAVGAIDEDLPAGIQSRGYAFKVEFPSAYRVEGDRNLTGQECQTDPNPCFTAVVHVKVVGTNVPTAQAVAAQLAVATNAGAQAAGLPTLNQQAAPVQQANSEFDQLFTSPPLPNSNE